MIVIHMVLERGVRDELNNENNTGILSRTRSYKPPEDCYAQHLHVAACWKYLGKWGVFVGPMKVHETSKRHGKHVGSWFSY